MNGPGVTPPIWPVGPSGGRPGGRPGGRLRGVRRWWRGWPGLRAGRRMAWRLGGLRAVGLTPWRLAALLAGGLVWVVVFGELLQLTGGQPGIPVLLTAVVGWFGVWSPFLSQTSVGMRVAQ